MVIILHNFSSNGPTLFICFVCFFKASHSPYIFWNSFEALLHRIVDLALQGERFLFFLFNLKKKKIQGDPLYSRLAFTCLQKDFAVLLTDPTAQDFLDPEKS
ncbi:hypothetical protein I79_005984 [Cricetulus griseus]|uniref:Uncharacterized protein n=1 Tax=Cricetulus griseus TaxID=10029 RepID=G3H6L9_CRIGR|nr:hypothetical protein I79_005984 [Cricetulus griseus]